MKPDSPLRYPGGKAALAGFLRETMERNQLTGGAYYEPFAGGAGAALRLLRDGVASDIYLNDLDRCIFAFWYAALTKPDQFKEEIDRVPLTVDEWKRQRMIYENGRHKASRSASRSFELGFATFYLNRCSRSGIIVGSAPIGGYKQEGRWRIDARFPRARLAERIDWLASHATRIHLSNKDALRFLVDDLPRGRRRERIFVYLDPPYYVNSRRLYYTSYQTRDHRQLAIYLKRQRVLKWLMSYDDAPFIRTLYSNLSIDYHHLQYSLQTKTRTQELLIAPSHVSLPTGTQSHAA